MCVGRKEARSWGARGMAGEKSGGAGSPQGKELVCRMSGSQPGEPGLLMGVFLAQDMGQLPVLLINEQLQQAREGQAPTHRAQADTW